MVKNHMKRLKAPRTWKLHRKDKKFVTKPNPGAHNQLLSVSINMFMKEMANIVKTTKETKYMLTKQEVLVNGKRIRDDKYAVGLFDIVTVPSIKKSFRITLDKAGNLKSFELKKDENITLLRVAGKKVLGKDKVQINTRSGRNLIVKNKDAKTYKTGDTLIIKVPENKIEKHISREKGVQVFIFTGKHIGKIGTLEAIDSRTAKVKVGKEIIETHKGYVIVVGKEKAEFEI